MLYIKSVYILTTCHSKGLCIAQHSVPEVGGRLRLQIKALDEGSSGLDKHELLHTDDSIQSFVFTLRQHRRGAENLFIITSEKHQVKSPSSI